MIDATEELTSQIEEATRAIDVLAAKIRALPDTKVINVIYKISTVGTPPAGGDIIQSAKIVETVTGGGTIENVTVGGNGDQIVKDTRALLDEANAAQAAAVKQGTLAAATAAARSETAAQIRDTQRVAAAMYEEELNLRDIAAAEQEASRDAGLFAGQLEQEAAYAERVAEMTDIIASQIEDEANATKQATAAAREHVAAMREEEAWARRYAQASQEMQQELEAIDAAYAKNADAINYSAIQMMEEAYQEARVSESTGKTTLTLLAMAAGAKDAGGSVGKILIPALWSAAGITGGAAVAFGLTASAIHLIIMGSFEFLAVFLPAMYAAAAAATVMSQGVQNVKTQLSSMQTVTSALGDTFNTTSGDVLGLGHSLKTAMDYAQPGVYELLGEAIMGVKDAMGQLNSQGLSPFGQLGLDVTHMLDAFGAKLVVDVQNNIGGVNQLLGQAQTDLREFGQILGNVGHAIFNFAQAMPGAAELVLKVVDAISWLVEKISTLPAPLLYGILVIEELYRWSGILVGIFGILGRAIALIGTLGIPVFAKIGLNFGQMVANIISGVGGAIINFVAMGEKIGVFGAKVDGVATRMVGALGSAASFMTGPWGAAIAIGALAVGALFFALSRVTSATDNFINSINKTVSNATNLQVLNVISQGMQQAVAKTTQAVQNLNRTVASGPPGGGRFAWEGYAGAISNAAKPVQQLTGEQQKLFDQSLTTVQGADTISKAYGFDFTTALGLADAAGVKLANGQLVLGKNANQAGIQIEGLVQGYAQMDQTGNTLANSMNAINVQAGLQASKVGAVNQAWDQFIQNATGLTGSFTQFNLDLQQMGNQAQTTGSKIQAFTGNTQLSVGQIAQALKSFTGSSAQTWQSFNQSVQQANTFMDNLRTAAAAGVVPQQQFGQAVAYMVQQLLPYAKNSKAALAEVDALAQEAGGPATTNFQTLKSWVDRNSTSSQNFSGMIDTLTQKMSNVTQVARNFAGTLQSDVLNAIANAAIGTGNITSLTEKYTQALSSNKATAPQVQAAQDALTQALVHYGFTATEIKQVEQELSTAYGHNQTAAGNATGATQGYGNSADTAKGKSAGLATTINTILDPALNHIPSPHVQLTESASGVFTLGGMVLTGQQALAIAQMNPLKHAAGGIIPGYAPGQDTIPALLSPGEGILTPQAVRMIGGGTVHSINAAAKRFAEGGIAGGIGGVPAWATTDNNAFESLFTVVMNKTMGGTLAGVKNGLAALQKNLNSSGFGIPVTGTPANLMPFFAAAIALTGVPSSWMFALETIARYESGFNVNAINLTDINAQNGDPSRGLMQVIMGTFDAYHQPGTSWNIYDPVANIAAAIRYIEARYGSVFNVPGIVSLGKGGGYVGYDSGGLLMPGLTMAYNGTGAPERVLPNGAGEGNIIHNVVNLDGKTIWENQQQYTLRYSLRNSGAAKGIWSPL